MLDARGLGELEQVTAQRADVVRAAHRLQRGVEPAGQPRVLGGDAGRAVVGVALLRLDAPDREHRLAADVHQVRTQRERDDGVLRQPELAGADEHHALVQAGLGEDLVDPAEAQAERQAHRVGEDQRRRARPALAAVDRHVVDPAAGARHQRDQFVPEPQVADGRLDPDRQPGLVGEHLDEVEQPVDVGELRVPRRADAVHALRHPARRGDLRRHLDAGQHTTEPRLGALAELDLQRAHRRRGHRVLEPGEVEAAVLVTAAEVAAADLVDQVAAAAVVGRDAALAAVLQAPRQRRAAVERGDGVGRQRTEAHAGDVDDGVGPERVPSAARGAEHLRARQPRLLAAVLARRRDGGTERPVLDDHVAGRALDVVVGAEPEVVVLELGRGVDPAALVAGERAFVVVAGDDVLAQLRPDPLDEVAAVADHGEVAQDRVPALDQVVGRDRSGRGDRRCRPEGRPRPSHRASMRSQPGLGRPRIPSTRVRRPRLAARPAGRAGGHLARGRPLGGRGADARRCRARPAHRPHPARHRAGDRAATGHGGRATGRGELRGRRREERRRRHGQARRPGAGRARLRPGRRLRHRGHRRVEPPVVGGPDVLAHARAGRGRGRPQRVGDLPRRHRGGRSGGHRGGAGRRVRRLGEGARHRRLRRPAAGAGARRRRDRVPPGAWSGSRCWC